MSNSFGLKGLKRCIDGLPRHLVAGAPAAAAEPLLDRLRRWVARADQQVCYVAADIGVGVISLVLVGQKEVEEACTGTSKVERTRPRPLVLLAGQADIVVG